MKPAAKPTMHTMGANTPKRSENDIIADQVAAILAKRNGSNAETWEAQDAATTAKDAAKIAVQAATATKSDRKLICSELSEQKSTIDTIIFAQTHLERRFVGMDARMDTMKNNIILWGLATGFFGALMGILIFMPKTPTASPVPAQNQLMRVR